MTRLVFLQFWAYISILLFCDCGDRVINRFSDIDTYFLCNWHLYPTKIRRILPTIIQNTQLVVALEAYGNFPCSRDTYKRVILRNVINPQFAINIESYLLNFRYLMEDFPISWFCDSLLNKQEWCLNLMYQDRILSDWMSGSITYCLFSCWINDFYSLHINCMTENIIGELSKYSLFVDPLWIFMSICNNVKMYVTSSPLF